MTNAIAVLNAGSSSLKFSLHGVGDTLSLVVKGRMEGIGLSPRFVAKDPAVAVLAEERWDDAGAIDHDGAVEHLFAYLASAFGRVKIVAIGHRVVHGGMRYRAPVRVDAAVIDALTVFEPLAPLHQPRSLTPIRAIAARRPDLPQIACFDTAFHRDQPPVAQAFALPADITDEGVCRYGFHGLSYEYVAGAMRMLDVRAAAGRVVVAHLGNGASMCAMADGRSVASTMGFTALDGLVMGTRSGTIDPGVLIWLMDSRGMGARDLESLLYHRSGLLGVSGISSDMRTLLASDDPRAKAAVELFCYRAGRELGSLVATLGGLDALVFTGGIGEHAAPIRAAIVRGAGWLGLTLDEAANAAGKRRVTTDTSKVPAYVVPTDEELMIARHVRSVLGI